MARIEPLAREDLSEHEEGFAVVEQMMGFVPNSMFTMARVPGLLPAFRGLGAAVFGNGLIPPQLVQMVAQVASTAAGCRYCQAHTGHNAGRLGVAEEKLAELWRFETSQHFDDAERAALRLAFHAGQVPNVATDDDFVEAIVATISFFGYLNRWNDTMATELEAPAVEFGNTVLADAEWEIGKHDGATPIGGGA